MDTDIYPPRQQPEGLLRPLLDYLAGRPAGGGWREWRVERIGGGANNLLYRATGPDGDLAVKFTIRDDRERAEREYRALLALGQLGLAIAPAPVLLDSGGYAQPVVVQRWLEGAVIGAPPATDGEWRALLDHFAAIHSVTPARVCIELWPSVFNMNSALEGKRSIQQQVSHIPTSARPSALSALVRRVERAPFPDWPAPPPALCRVDPNTVNIIRRPGRWSSVDWENSGWGDPAFEIAGLMAHPTYAAVSPERWEWVIDTYCAMRDDSAAARRIRVYYPLMLVWWAARLARRLYDIPLGLDRRLIDPPPGWQADAEAKLDRYVGLALLSLG